MASIEVFKLVAHVGPAVTETVLLTIDVMFVQAVIS